MPVDPPLYYLPHVADAKLLAFARQHPEGRPIGVKEAAAAAGTNFSAAGTRIAVLRSFGAWPWPSLSETREQRSEASLKSHIARREARCKPR